MRLDELFAAPRYKGGKAPTQRLGDDLIDDLDNDDEDLEEEEEEEKSEDFDSFDDNDEFGFNDDEFGDIEEEVEEEEDEDEDEDEDYEEDLLDGDLEFGYEEDDDL